MNRTLILAALGAIAVALVAVIGMELLAYRGDDEVAARTAQPPAETAAGEPTETAEEAKTDAEEGPSAAGLASDVLARPLFAPSRRPPSRPVAAADAQDSTLPRLTGIVMLTGLRLAIFQGTDKPVVVREGGRVAGRKVETIGPLEVVLTGPQGEERMRPMPDSTLLRERVVAPAQPVARPIQPLSPFANRPRPQQQEQGEGPQAGRRPAEGRPPPNQSQTRPPPPPGRAFIPPNQNRNSSP